MMRRAVQAACLLSVLQFGRAQVRIISPQWLVEVFRSSNGRIEGTTSTFGAPYYGDRILGRLIWGDSKHGHAHCRDDDYDTPVTDPTLAESSSSPSALINVVMVRRGKCSFVRKVLVAQEKKEAHAVIIIDKEDSTMTSKELKNLIPGDDGYGASVHIPSMLIAKDDGKQLINAAKSSEVVVELQWEVPTNHYVQVDLWMASASRESQKFLKEFADKRHKLDYWIKFIPHYTVFKLSQGKDYNDLCTDSSGSYCAEDPDGSSVITGKDVLDEDVRQLCIHELTKVAPPPGHAAKKYTTIGSRPYSAKFWEYVSRFGERCPLPDKTVLTPETQFGEACSETLMREVGIDVQAVQLCASRTKYDKLKHELDNSAWSPRALRINGWRYMGMMDADLVTRAICSGFTHQPDECKDLLAPRDPFKDFRMQTPPKGISFGTLMLALLSIFLLTMCGMMLYKRGITKNLHRQLREDVMLEVQSQMDSYKRVPG
jgi:hypothetical protein